MEGSGLWHPSEASIGTGAVQHCQCLRQWDRAQVWCGQHAVERGYHPGDLRASENFMKFSFQTKPFYETMKPEYCLLNIANQ